MGCRGAWRRRAAAASSLSFVQAHLGWTSRYVALLPLLLAPMRLALFTHSSTSLQAERKRLEQGKAAPVKRPFLPMDDDDTEDNGAFAAPGPSATAASSSASSSHVRRGDHMRAPTSTDKDDTPTGSLLKPAHPPAKKSGFSTDMCAPCACPCTAPPHPCCFRYDVQASPAASVLSSASTAMGGRSGNGAQSISSRQVHSISLVLSSSLLHLLICFCQSSSSMLVRQQQRRWTPEEAQRYASEREIESDRTWYAYIRKLNVMFPTSIVRYDQDESGARDVSEEMESFSMKGRGDDATLTERQVKRLSARQVRACLLCFLENVCKRSVAGAAAHALRSGPAKPGQRHVGRKSPAAERRGAANQCERRGGEGLG